MGENKPRTLEDLIVWRGYARIKNIYNLKERCAQVSEEFKNGRIKWHKKEFKAR